MYVVIPSSARRRGREYLLGVLATPYLPERVWSFFLGLRTCRSWDFGALRIEGEEVEDVPEDVC